MLTKLELETIIREVAEGNSLGIRMMEGNLPFEEPVNQYILRVSQAVGDGVTDPTILDKIVSKASLVLSPYLLPQ